MNNSQFYSGFLVIKRKEVSDNRDGGFDSFLTVFLIVGSWRYFH